MAWWTLSTTKEGELSEDDRNHMAERIKEGYNEQKP